MKKEIDVLKTKEDRFNKAYASGLMELGQLQEYIMPIREKVLSLQALIVDTERKGKEVSNTQTPTTEEIKSFAEAAKRKLKNLDFDPKRAIVLSTIDKIVASHDKLTVKGYLPITSPFYEYKTISRNCRSSKRR